MQSHWNPDKIWCKGSAGADKKLFTSLIPVKSYFDNPDICTVAPVNIINMSFVY